MSETCGGEIWAAKQFESHLTEQELKKCECSVKVFNSSVENRVEKDAARLRIARPAKAYFTLHYFCAVCSGEK
jgi:hypothetical protein